MKRLPISLKTFKFNLFTNTQHLQHVYEFIYLVLMLIYALKVQEDVINSV